MIPLAEFAPDRSDFDASAASYMRNVLPRANGSYGPVNAMRTYGDALPAQPRGGFYATLFGEVGVGYFFAGTSTNLYRREANHTWDNVSRTSGGAYTTLTSTLWSPWNFTQFGAYVIANSLANVPQVFTLASSTDFANLSGSPPQAIYNAVIGDFVFMGSVLNAADTIYWSGLNDHTHWTVGRKSCDLQTFPDGGAITGIIGFEKGGLVFQEDCVREVTPVLDTPLIFTFKKTENELGVKVPGSIVPCQRDVFFYGDDGFYRYGNPSTPIGRGRVDEWFRGDMDLDYRYLMQGATDPKSKVVYWRYKSRDHILFEGGVQSTDRVLVYDYGYDRWSVFNMVLTWLGVSFAGGITMDPSSIDDFDGNGPYSLETLPFSLDSSVYMNRRDTLSGFNTSFVQGYFDGNGPTLEALVQTADIEFEPGRRTFVNGFRPVCDANLAGSVTTAGEATPLYGRVGVRSNHGATREWKQEKPISTRTGLVPARAEGRLHRFEVRIPAEVPWNDIHGIVPSTIPAGDQ